MLEYRVILISCTVFFFFFTEKRIFKFLSREEVIVAIWWHKKIIYLRLSLKMWRYDMIVEWKEFFKNFIQGNRIMEYVYYARVYLDFTKFSNNVSNYLI